MDTKLILEAVRKSWLITVLFATMSACLMYLLADAPAPGAFAVGIIMGAVGCTFAALSVAREAPPPKGKVGIAPPVKSQAKVDQAESRVA